MSDEASARGPWFTVPVGTPAAQCRSCKEVVFWIVTPAGKRMPVDCEVSGGWAPCDDRPPTDGYGVSHFATCADADRWRRPR